MAIQENRVINYLATLLCCSICVQRLSTAAGNAFFILAILLFFYLLFQRKRTGVSIIPSIDKGIKGYYKAFGILILCFLPSALCTGNPTDGVQFVTNQWIYRWFPFFAITLFIRDKESLTKILMAFMIAIGLDCLTAVWQSFILNKYRAWGFGDYPMHLAAMLCYIIPVLTVFVLDKQFGRSIKAFAVISLVCCLAGVLVGNSRGAWLTLFIILPLISWTYIKNNKKFMCIAGIICCLLVGLFAVNPSYQHRLISIANTTTDRSNADRILVWESAQKMIKDHPIVGVGPGKFKEVYDKEYKSPKVTQNLHHSHNNFIQITAEYGFIGLSGFLYFVIYILKRNYYEIKAGNPYARMRFGALLGILLFGLIDYTLNSSAIIKAFGFIFAVLIALDSKYNEK